MVQAGWLDRLQDGEALWQEVCAPFQASISSLPSNQGTMQEKRSKEKDRAKKSQLERQEEMSARKRKTYHDIDPEEAIQALANLKNDPHFKKYIEMREAMREEVIRQLQTKTVIDSTNRHYMMCGKLEAIDEELDTFYKL